jgi:hypothetical protein
MSDEKREVRFLVRDETNRFPGDDSMRIILDAVNITADGEVRNIGESSWNEPNAAFANFAVTAYVKRSRDDWIGGSDGTYGWDEQPFTVDLERAEIMVKHLRKVQRRLDAMNSELGYPETFAGYVARVAKVCGVKRFGVRYGKAAAGWHASNEYRWMDAAGIAAHLGMMIENYREPKVNA